VSIESGVARLRTYGGLLCYLRELVLPDGDISHDVERKAVPKGGIEGQRLHPWRARCVSQVQLEGFSRQPDGFGRDNLTREPVGL